jgi:hypothetical protein
VLRDDVVVFTTDDGALATTPVDGWYLLRIDPTTSPLADLPSLLERAGFEGAFSFSSEAGARTFALGLREGDRALTLNVVLELLSVQEHPLVATPTSDADYLDFAALPYMTWAGDTSNPSIGIGVVRAWDYLRQLGLPPDEGIWQPARVAILDVGFALDPVTGVGSLDWPGLPGSPPLQVDTVDSDNRAGSLKEGWHGEGTFGVCCATPRNRFGGAGRGGEYVRPIAIRVALGYSDLGAGVWSAINMGADVVR